MKVGLIGFGKTGKSVASILLENKEFCLEWVLRQSTVLKHRSVPEFFGAPSDEPGLIYSTSKTTIAALRILVLRIPLRLKITSLPTKATNTVWI